MKLLVVRQSLFGDPKRCLGRSDPPCAQNATLIAGRLNALSWTPQPALVWSSSLRRCVEPARLLASHLQAQVIVDDRVVDGDMGTWTGHPWTSIAKTEKTALSDWIRAEAAPHGGEGVEQIERRVRRWWAGLDGKTCHALVAHDIVAIALHVVVHHQSWTNALNAPFAQGHFETFVRVE